MGLLFHIVLYGFVHSTDTGPLTAGLGPEEKKKHNLGPLQGQTI